MPTPHAQRLSRTTRRRLAWGTAAVLVAGVAVPTFAYAGPGGGQDLATAKSGHRAKNVIVLIGDGMGDSEITLARDYTAGANGRLNMDRFPATGAYTTYAVDEKGKPDYVTDSAASGTGWATGYKTVNGRISKTHTGTGKPKPTMLELAKKKGLATGDVTTAELTDATPAVQNAHVTDRDCQGPEDMKTCPEDTLGKGGEGSIAEQTVTTGADVLMGGGKARFDQKISEGRYKGKTVTEQAEQAGYRLVTDKKGLASARPDQPLLGLFAPETVPVEWTGKKAAKGGTDPQRCTTSNPERPATTPALAQQTSKAIDLLEAKQRAKKSGKGFFLQVEGASIDKQDHAADPCGQIGETAAFDRAVKVAQDYAKKHPDTLVVTTADHGHASQIVPVDAKPAGLSSTLVTDEGQPLQVSYSNNDPAEDQEHTGTQVRIAGMGPASDRVRGVTDQTDLFGTVTGALRLR
ncbi:MULTISPECIES: alkaline phosphatase [unclassified Streptomyces]|uniref:alkaline phosphatase n=1 Tax=unclassified Streptomyces TaxID=2593676 RepID=UPI002DD81884|nr:alkaline phosphatase [Streptomyces sp. NBC_01795]WSA92708.1 alkaline phosphatase [Streptomyces sp. NBC_01795]WSS43468.1 alkaline phosphatase [Streptomyces sp. NBC_01187]